MKRQEYTISYFICPECGNSLPLPRPLSHKRNVGRNKWLHCAYCKKDVNTIEVRKGDVYVRNNGNIIYA